MPSDSRYQVIHSALQQTATATTHRSSLCGVCVCAGLELLVDVHVLTTGVQFPGQHFGAAACGGVLLVRFWNSLCGPILYLWRNHGRLLFEFYVLDTVVLWCVGSSINY